MSPFLLLALTIIIFAAVAAGVIYLLYLYLVNFQPSNSKIKKDLQELRDEIAPWVEELVPWKKEELELLSLQQTNRVLKKRVVTTVKGVFTSIYHEPLVAYAFKRYVSGQANAILYARTSHHEFTYRIKNNEVQLHIDKQYVGRISQSGQLFNARTDQLMGHIQMDENSGLLPVVIGDRELASLTPSDGEAMNTGTRAFQFLNENISEDEETLMLSLSILEMVRMELPIK